MKIPFLTAHWQDLVVITYEVPPNTLTKYLPRGTEIDLFNGKTYVSLVAFRFNQNKFLGLLPTYPAYSFEEVNLRFYIKREDKRAVAFIKEVVPSKFIAQTARLLYNEPYVALRTSSKKTNRDSSVEYTYSWGQELEQEIIVEAEKTPQKLEVGTLEEFILEHYWGYTAQPDAHTVEYQVTHPKWEYRKGLTYRPSESVKSFYGSDFENILSGSPASIVVAEGSIAIAISSVAT